MQRILVVEDEESIRKLLKMNLELEGYEVSVADRGDQALKAFKSEHFDLILLDIMLPQVSGFQICEQIRLINPDIPILILSAKDSSSDKVKGLKLGADDYLAKPFNLEELILRIQKLLVRSNPEEKKLQQSYTFGNNEIDFKTYQAKGNHGNFTLTNKEALLLRMLIERKNEVVSRQQILQTVWGYDVYPSTRTIDNFILSFRKYFEKDPKTPQYFQSIRGVGYKFVN